MHAYRSTKLSSPIRIIVPIDSMETEAWKLAFGYADAMAVQQTPPVRDVVLLTHTKDQIRHTSLAGFLGQGIALALGKGRTINLPSGATLRHATMRTIGFSANKSIVIVSYGEERILNLVDGLRGLVGVVVVPEFANSADKWAERWNPIVHGEKRTAPVPLIDDAVVAKAFKELALFVNLSHSFIHPRDRQHINETLRILRAKGHILEPSKIESWAIRNGWQPKAAGELANFAGKIAALKSKPSLAGFFDPDTRYARWHEDSVTD